MLNSNSLQLKIKCFDRKNYKNQLFVIDNQHTKLIQINYPRSRFCAELMDVFKGEQIFTWHKKNFHFFINMKGI